MTEFNFEAQSRGRAGKGSARALRREGQTPAVIYGDKKEPTLISIPSKELRMTCHKTGFFTNFISVKVDGKEHKVLAKDIHYHPVTDIPLHVDFLRVGKGTKITVEVPVVFVDEDKCPGLKKGGVLNITRHTVEISCGADNIPETLSISIAEFEVGDSIHISNFKLPEGATPTISDRDFTVATIAAPTISKASEEVAEESEEAEEGAEGTEEEASEETTESE